MKNPFVTNGYVSPEYFCDREKETAKIVSLLTNENNIALISPRRLGKTDLLRHCFGQPEIKEHYHTFIIDIYATSSVRDFVNVFGKAVLDELRPKGKSVWGTFLNVLASLRSEITFDMNGQPTWGIGLGAITNPSATLDEIFSECDIVSLHCPLTETTRNLVNAERLAMMKPTAILINTGRGPLVNEKDLADALNNGVIAAAGVDVLSSEPPKADNPLLTAKNCFITPHIAWATHAARARLMKIAVDNLRGYISGNVINNVAK